MLRHDLICWTLFSRLIFLSLSVLCGLQTGCSNNTSGYDKNLKFAPRQDLLVLEPPKADPDELPEAGKLLEYLEALPQLGAKTLDPKQLSLERRQELTKILEENFGTPAHPKFPTNNTFAFTEDQLSRGAALYSRQCSYCHGVSGDGKGPTGMLIYPYPRDFRTGQFKYTHHGAANAKPTFEDLQQILRQGVTGTSMPIYDLISDQDRADLAAVVTHLSVRGEVEFRLLRRLLDAGELEPIDDLTTGFFEEFTQVERSWEQAKNSPSELASFGDLAEPDPENADHVRLMTRGWQLFALKEGVGCLNCHQDYGRRNHYKYDSWGLPNRVGLLASKEYRWGRSPDEIAHRIYYGIKPANMPGHPTLSKEDQRALVLFLRALPSPERLPEKVRKGMEQRP